MLDNAKKTSIKEFHPQELILLEYMVSVVKGRNTGIMAGLKYLYTRKSQSLLKTERYSAIMTLNRRS